MFLKRFYLEGEIKIGYIRQWFTEACTLEGETKTGSIRQYRLIQLQFFA
jgi:hypothetical protein